MFDDVLLLKFTVSQDMERMKIKNVTQQMKIDATPLSPVDSKSIGINRL